MAEQNRQWQTSQDGLDKAFQTSGPVPKPGNGEVLVRVKAVSLNYRDTEGKWKRQFSNDDDVGILTSSPSMISGDGAIRAPQND